MATCCATETWCVRFLFFFRENYQKNTNFIQEVSIVKWDTGTGQGKCKPVPHFGAPQGFIADGEDGSHWV